MPTADQIAAQGVDAVVRVEGDAVTFEVYDHLDPAQREDHYVFVQPCTCNLPPERADFRYCTCGVAAEALALMANLRRQYATQIDLTGAVLVGAKR